MKIFDLSELVELLFIIMTVLKTLPFAVSFYSFWAINAARNKKKMIKNTRQMSVIHFKIEFDLGKTKSINIRLRQIFRFTTWPLWLRRRNVVLFLVFDLWTKWQHYLYIFRLFSFRPFIRLCRKYTYKNHVPSGPNVITTFSSFFFLRSVCFFDVVSHTMS